MEKLSEKPERLVHILCIAAILVLTLANWNKLGIITIVDDEFGYWGNAAQLAGLHWEPLLMESQFYSYGYGILLSPLFRMGISARSMFHIAVAMNIFLLLCSFELALNMGRTLFPSQKDTRILAAALVTTLFSNNIFQTQMGAPEVLIYFLFWCIAVSLMNVMIKKRRRDILCLICATAYIYPVHNRCIGVVAVVVAATALLAFIYRKEAYGRYLLLGLLVLLVLFGLAEGIRKFAIAQWFQNNERIAVNDYSGSVNKIRKIFSLKGIVIFTLSICGKLFSQGMGSFLFTFLSFSACIGYLVRRIRKREKNWRMEEFLAWFLMLCYLAEIMITAIHKNYTPRELPMGRIMMGRYVDFVVGPLLMIAVCRVWGRMAEKWEIVVCTLVFLLVTAATALQAEIAGSDAIIPFNNMDIAFWTRIFPQNAAGIVCMGLIAVTVFWIGWYVMQHGLRQAFLYLLVIGCFWGICGMRIAGEHIDTKREKANAYLYPIHEFVSGYDMETKIYYVKDQEDEITRLEYLKLLQYLEPERSICAISEEEMKGLKETDNYLLMSGVVEATVERLKETYDLKCNSGRLCVYTPD